jgi:integrase
MNKAAGETVVEGLTAHIFRHNYCTELCYQVPTISTKMIARLLGDDERMVIEVYSHLVEERESTYDAINEIFNL